MTVFYLRQDNTLVRCTETVTKQAWTITVCRRTWQARRSDPTDDVESRLPRRDRQLTLR